MMDLTTKNNSSPWSRYQKVKFLSAKVLVFGFSWLSPNFAATKA